MLNVPLHHCKLVLNAFVWLVRLCQYHRLMGPTIWNTKVYLDVEIETGQMSDDIHCAAVIEAHTGKPLA